MKQNVGKVMTVLGPIDPKDCGPTLPHEHTLCWLVHRSKKSDDPIEALQYDKPITMENLRFVHENPYAVKEACYMYDEDLMIEELKRYKANGGGTICDLTREDCTDALGADYEHWKKIRHISEASGVNIVCAVGHFFKSAQPAYVADMTVEQLADFYINIINNGYGDTGIRPGIMGELGMGNVRIHEDEWKVLRAACLASNETGLAINIHINAPMWEYDFDILDTIEEMGTSTSRVALSHRCGILAHKDWDFHDGVDHLCALADRGCYVEIDSCGLTDSFFMDDSSWDNCTDRDRAIALKKLVLRGHGKRVLISMDTAHRYYYTSYGGYAYSHIQKKFRDICLAQGITESMYDNFSIHNPQRLITIT